MAERSDPRTLDTADSVDARVVQVYEEKITILESRLSYLERIVKIGQILNSTLELEPLLRIITQVATELTNTEACSILLYDPDRDALKFMPATASSHRDRLLDITVPLNNSVAGWIYQKARPILIRDAKNDHRWNSIVDDSSGFNTRSILGVPLRSRNEVIGVMELINKLDEQGFNQDDIEIATALSNQAAIAIQNAKLWDDLQKAYEELAALDQLKTEILSQSSNSLKNPLSVILDYANNLQHGAQEDNGEHFVEVVDNAVKLRGLIDRMVSLRHIRNNNIQLDISIFSLRDLLQEILSEFDTLIVAKSLRVKQQIATSDDPFNIEADRQKLYLVIANLISNAVKFTPKEGVLLVGLGRSNDRIVLRVADTGQGIPQEDFETIFTIPEHINTLDPRGFDGEGLGLPIAKGLVDAHNGTIQVESVLGRGSQFTVTLPITLMP